MSESHRSESSEILAILNQVERETSRLVRAVALLTRIRLQDPDLWAAIVQFVHAGEVAR
jgi:hypothetical protein